MTLFTLTYNEFYPSVYGFAAKMVGKTDAEDITLKVFYKLYRVMDSIDPCSRKAWLMITTKNDCLTHLTAKKNNKTQMKIYRDQQPLSIELDLEDEVVRLLHEQVNLLPPQCRRIMKLKLVGWTGTEIAAELGLSHSTVRNQVFIAITKLRMGYIII